MASWRKHYIWMMNNRVSYLGPRTVTASRVGSLADRLLRKIKQKRQRKSSETILWREQNYANFAYLGVLHSRERNTISPVLHRAEILKNLPIAPTDILEVADRPLSEQLRLRLWRKTTIATLLHVCELWTLTYKVLRRMKCTASKMLPKITGRTNASEDVILWIIDRRWNCLREIIRIVEDILVRRVLVECVTAPRPWLPAMAVT